MVGEALPQYFMALALSLYFATFYMSNISVYQKDTGSSVNIHTHVYEPIGVKLVNSRSIIVPDQLLYQTSKTHMVFHRL